MSVKQKFLDQLRANLRKYPSGAVDDYIDYYDELITERVASGENEAAVLAHIGTPKDIAASFKHDNAINRAVKKPTASNGIKALVAVLSVLSLPFLIPVAAVILALTITAIALFVAGLAVLALGVVASVLSVIDITSVVVAGDAPVYLLFLVTGGALIAVFLAFEFIRGLIFVGRWVIRTLIHKLNARRHNRKEQ
jgi:uncharacterized membrane protein